MKFLVIALFLLATASTFSYQQRSRKCDMDLRIAGDKPSIFISFDHYGRREPLRVAETSEGVWLRLHNNTRATIFLPSYGVPKEVGEVGLFYDVLPVPSVNDSVSTVPARLPAGRPQGHTAGSYLLRPGSTVSFSVPREHLPERSFIRIVFNYEWELEGEQMGAVRSGEPTHYAYFYSSSLTRR